MIGGLAGLIGEGSNNVFIGYSAGYDTEGDNLLEIANSSLVDPLIYGEFDTPLLKINGDFTATGTVQLGNNGTSFTSVVTETVAYNAPSINGNDVFFYDFPLTQSISTNSTVHVSASGDLPASVFIGQAYVIGGNKVRVKFLNEGNNSQNPSLLNYRFTIINF
jgi:hypothetical protein